jgi:hypothetical protein
MNDTTSPDPAMREAIEAFQKKIAEQAEQMEKVARDGLAKSISSFVEPFALMSRFFRDNVAAWQSQNQEVIATVTRLVASAAQVSAQIADVMAEASERFNEALKSVDDIAKLGWTFPSNLYFVDLLRLSKFTNPADADAYVLKWYEENDSRLEEMEARLLGNNRLASFRTVLSQCFAAFRREEYALIIPSLMPILEDVVKQLDPPHLRASTDLKKTLRKDGPIAKQAQQDILTAAIWLSLATFINDLYAPRPLAGGPQTLSRHLIEHGRKEPPNEKIEVIRLFHPLETALSLHIELRVSILPVSRS